MADPVQLPPSEARQGWKEIADFFGVTTRTVQLWEREKGLPVRRLPGGRVYAVDEELRAWVENGSAARLESVPPSTPRRLHWAWTLLLIPLCAALFWPWWKPVYPAAASVTGNTLTVADDDGKELWRVTLPASPSIFAAVLENRSPVRLFDIDGDGRQEVLAAVQSPNPQDSDELLCYSSRGQLRWRWKAGGKVRTAAEDLSGKYAVANMLPWASGARRGLLVATVSVLSFASQVALLDDKGRIQRQYWHAGHLHPMLLADSDGDGRQELWTGGIHNPSGHAVVVVLDPDLMEGASPESVAKYQILDRGPAREVARWLLHRSEPSLAVAPFHCVINLHFEGNGIAVGTQETFPGDSGNFPSMLYKFEGEGALTSASIVDNSKFVYAAMEAQHLITPGALERDRAHLREITWLKRWGRD